MKKYLPDDRIAYGQLETFAKSHNYSQSAILLWRVLLKDKLPNDRITPSTKLKLMTLLVSEILAVDPDEFFRQNRLVGGDSHKLLVLFQQELRGIKFIMSNGDREVAYQEVRVLSKSKGMASLLWRALLGELHGASNFPPGCKVMNYTILKSELLKLTPAEVGNLQNIGPEGIELFKDLKKKLENE